MPKYTFTPTLPSTAAVSVLGAINEKRQFQAQLVHCSGRMMKLRATEDVQAGLPVRIDVDGGLVLGEVSSSVAVGEDTFLLIQIDQVIPSVTDLANLVSAVLGQRMPSLAPQESSAMSSAAAIENGQTVPVRGGSAR